jgi:hypothetical protein
VPPGCGNDGSLRDKPRTECGALVDRPGDGRGPTTEDRRGSRGGERLSLGDGGETLRPRCPEVSRKCREVLSAFVSAISSSTGGRWWMTHSGWLYREAEEGRLDKRGSPSGPLVLRGTTGNGLSGV